MHGVLRGTEAGGRGYAAGQVVSGLPRHDPALGSSGWSVMHTPRRRGNGRPLAAQFAPRAVYIPGGSATWCGRKARRMVTADLLSRARAGDGEAFLPGADRAAPAGAAGALLPGRWDPSPTPRTPSRRRCWPPGKASAGSPRSAPRCAPGCTSIPTSRCLNARRAASLAPGQGVAGVSVCTARADPARRGRLAAAVS